MRMSSKVKYTHLESQELQRKNMRKASEWICIFSCVLLFLITGAFFIAFLQRFDVLGILKRVNSESGLCRSFPSEVQTQAEELLHRWIKMQDSCFAKQIPLADRFDCLPEANGTQAECIKRGCCWSPVTGPGVDGAPFCYYPNEYPFYRIDSNNPTTFGETLSIRKTALSPYPKDVMVLTVDVYYETDNRLHIKIYDPAVPRYEVPIETPFVDRKASNVDYSVQYNQVGEMFTVKIMRKSTSTVLFSSDVGRLVFADQFLQMSTRLPTANVYGLAEHQDSLQHSVDWPRYIFWTKDHFPMDGVNLYGAHPFYLVMEDDGNCHGVFLLNSNTMEVVLQPTPALTFRALGGILDLYVFVGRDPGDVLRQYQAVVGMPAMVPYWALGFHLCRWGAPNDAYLAEVIRRNRAIGLPYDTQWTDSDYMNSQLDFTLDSRKWSLLPQIVDDLHLHGQHYVIITDPGISNTQQPGTYPPYDELVEQQLYLTDLDGMPSVGKCWPGDVVWPDFSHPLTKKYWWQQIAEFHNILEFDGLWIDMNEMSSGYNGSNRGCPHHSSLDYPPYLPPGMALGFSDNKTGGQLFDHTACPSARQYLSSHYNLHNLYGYMETKVTHDALVKVRGERALVISRSTFSGHGKYGGHWLGDNNSTWADMHSSIPGLLQFSMSGVPLVGADICGFRSNTTEELCTRWMQLGAFYPFSRNHNHRSSQDQDPAVFGRPAQEAMKTALKTRYLLLPYLYTLFHRSSERGDPVAAPLFFEFPKDRVTYSIDKQFMWGKALLISPCLEQGAVQVSAYFPEDVWYDFYTGEMVVDTGMYVTLNAPLQHINLHVRGGSILATQLPSAKAVGWPITTTQSRQNKFGLTVALAADKTAFGEMFWDDGVTVDTVTKHLYNAIQFNATIDTVRSYVKHANYRVEEMVLGDVLVLGVDSAPMNVMANNKPVTFHYNPVFETLNITDLSLPLLQGFAILWF